ncbi:hypothetical protein QQF64_011402 [Cirrhinus molitorella]|uniref:Uncharacterized protein n=1 Tax=Cirrhinus molitorella TaxID=172907 RepID=A0ABR3LZ43_9TELE
MDSIAVNSLQHVSLSKGDGDHWEDIGPFIKACDFNVNWVQTVEEVVEHNPTLSAYRMYLSGPVVKAVRTACVIDCAIADHCFLTENEMADIPALHELYHVNLLKTWVGTRDQLATLGISDPVVVDINPHLSAAQKTELQHLVSQFADVFSNVPRQTTIIEHDIQTPPGVVVRQRPYRVPEARRQAIEEEVQCLTLLRAILASSTN